MSLPETVNLLWISAARQAIHGMNCRQMKQSSGGLQRMKEQARAEPEQSQSREHPQSNPRVKGKVKVEVEVSWFIFFRFAFPFKSSGPSHTPS
jgi:hypothetical protein